MNNSSRRSEAETCISRLQSNSLPAAVAPRPIDPLNAFAVPRSLFLSFSFLLPERKETAL